MDVNKKAKELQEWVKSLGDEDSEYLLYSPWGHELQFAKKITKGESFGLVTTPIMKFKTDLTPENLTHIEKKIKEWVNENLTQTEIGR